MEGINDEALEKLTAYSWPGNIRELENTIRRAIVLVKSKILTAEDCVLQQQTEPANDFEQVVSRQIDKLFKEDESRPYRHLMSEVEQILIEKALDLCEGNQVQAAKLLGINRMTLRKKLDLSRSRG